MDIGDPRLPTYSLQSQNYFLACYAVSLIQGDSILGVTLRSKTVWNYLNSAADLFKQKNNKINPLYHSDINHVKIVVRALQNYEKVPNRRNMISDTMIHWMYTYTLKLPEDSIERAIFDWLLLGRYAGLRLSEWCQTSQSKFARIEAWPGQPPYAFVAGDFTFYGHHMHRFDSTGNIAIELIESVGITFRKQKNSDNGQVLTFNRDNANPAYCPVRAAFRIFKRAERLQPNPDEPIAVCKNRTNSKVIFITDSLTTKFIRKAAIEAHNVSPKSEDLSRWSTHSIRVTAANLLHRAGLSDSFIQTRLRWKSTAFLMYLRNTFFSADTHTKALHISDTNLPPPEARSYRDRAPHETLLQAPAA